MSRRRLTALSLILGVLLISALPAIGVAQSSAEIFEQTVRGESEALLLSGPVAFSLEQRPDVLSVYKPGLDVADFAAHAVFTNPSDDEGVPWDYGFQFRTTGNNEDLRLFVVSDGTWNFAVGVAAPEQSAVADNLDTALGASNTLDLVVEGSQALFGINGEFVGSIALPELLPSGDVYASTGFLGGNVAPGRIIELSDFSVYSLSSPAAAPAPLAPGEIPPARPVTLHSGSCANPGDVVENLREATYPVGEARGLPSAVAAETSFTRVPRFLDSLLDEPHAITVGASFDDPGTSIACADLGGIVDEIGGYVIALAPENASGYGGIVYLAGEDDLGRTNVSVFLVPVTAVAIPAATPVAETTAPVAEDAATPIPVITVEDQAAALEPQATPAG